VATAGLPSDAFGALLERVVEPAEDHGDAVVMPSGDGPAYRRDRLRLWVRFADPPGGQRHRADPDIRPCLDRLTTAREPLLAPPADDSPPFDEPEMAGQHH
jgi:hypothetical protein